MPGCQGTHCSKQGRYLKFKWLQRDSNLQPILRVIKNLFEHEEKENYYKPVRVTNFWSNNYSEYKSNCDKSKTLSVEEYLNKITAYLKDINNL